MNVFFDENGLFRLDEMALESATFRKIMEDNTVTDEEVTGQSELVITLFRRMEESFNAEQLSLVAEAVTQLGVLHAATQYQQIQEFHH
ncbi:hypothetical protein AGMMS49574_03880 [Bacteroidia bacterium]|nr:hypothetical protein AGMMS49574_03880 [Bacteroidia bacterium]